VFLEIHVAEEMDFILDASAQYSAVTCSSENFVCNRNLRRENFRT
jgi:hypothetical protein